MVAPYVANDTRGLAMAVAIIRRGPKQSPYTRRPFEDMPLYDDAYINPARAIRPAEMAMQSTEALHNRLKYIRQPGLGEVGSPEEQEAIKVELKRRK